MRNGRGYYLLYGCNISVGATLLLQFLTHPPHRAVLQERILDVHSFIQGFFLARSNPGLLHMAGDSLSEPSRSCNIIGSNIKTYFNACSNYFYRCHCQTLKKMHDFQHASTLKTGKRPCFLGPSLVHHGGDKSRSLSSNTHSFPSTFSGVHSANLILSTYPIFSPCYYPVF